MTRARDIWLVCNTASGSNDAEALAAVVSALDRAGLRIARRITFPDEPAPSAGDLRAAGIDALAVFAGDGTVNAVVTGLFGWEGLIHVLPGGTKNLLARRLHGDARPAEILGRLDTGLTRRVRPAILQSRHGPALTGVIAGPGTAWNTVREALREAAVGDVVQGIFEAVATMEEQPNIRCAQPACGRDAGYVAITLTPTEAGIETNGYYAETLADNARQGAALLQRDFRSGPHEWLGLHQTIRLELRGEAGMGLLIDGEPFEGAAREDFRLGPCEVDLLASADAA